MDKITIRKPDDFHEHLRRGEEMEKVVLPSLKGVFARAVAMGNLPEPIVAAEDVVKYRNEIVRAAGPGFEPIMTVMLIKKTTPGILEEAFAAGAKILKLIPGQTSTGSAYGISYHELKDYYPVIKRAEELGMVFSMHVELAAEENGDPVPFLEREYRAIPFLKKIISEFPRLKIVVEHASTRELIEAVKAAGPNVAAGLTYHHAVVIYDDVINKEGKIIDAFKYCMPVAKTDDDCKAVIEAMTSGNSKFFFGSDSAPHPIEKKQSDNPPAGIFTAPVALPGLAEIFEKEGKLEKLEDFVSRFGAEFYGMPLNTGSLELIKEDWAAPEMVGNVKVFRGGETFKWRTA
ncbi:MAG: amidohydrolase family protein [Patescibacteria group bacterium]|jgi:dihydroorotase